MGNVFGTYLHGVFDHPQMAQGIIEALCERKGISAEQISAVDFASYKETQYDLLAKGVRTALQEEGAVGILTGGLTAAAAGITTSLVCGVVCSWVGKSHDQN